MNNNVFESLAAAISTTDSVQLSAQCYRQAALSNDTQRAFFVNLGDLLASAPTAKATPVKGVNIAKSAVVPTEDKPKGKGGRPPGSKNRPKTEEAEAPMTPEEEEAELERMIAEEEAAKVTA